MSDVHDKISFEPQRMRIGPEWCVKATFPDGYTEQIVGFLTEAEAIEWIEGDQSKQWLRRRGRKDQLD
jgi:hypothetical protein